VNFRVVVRVQDFKHVLSICPCTYVYFIMISNLNKGLATTKHFIIL